MTNQAVSNSAWLAAARYLPSLAASVWVTEAFYKFRSFTLELMGCALTFAAIYFVQEAVVRMAKKATGPR